MQKGMRSKVLKLYVQLHYEEMQPRSLVLKTITAKYKSQDPEAIGDVCNSYDNCNNVSSDEIARQLLYAYRKELKALNEMATEIEAEHGMLAISKVKTRILADMGKLFVSPDVMKKVEDNLDIVLDMLRNG
jgi:hypothetical protein